LLQHFEACPGYDEPDFEPKFRSILDRLDIDLVFPAWDKLIGLFATWKPGRARFVVPNAQTAQKLLSKRETYSALSGVVRTPRIFEVGEQPAFPAFAKPDRSSGSKDAYRIDDAVDLASARKKELLVSEYLPGREYTVDCLNDLNGNLILANPRLRGKLGAGIALGSRDDGRSDLVEACGRISGALPIEGPWFAQFKEDASGAPVLVEVNARIAGSGGFTRLSGANIPLMSVFMFMGNEVRVPQIRHGLTVNRSLASWVEGALFTWVIWDLDDTLVRKDGKADPESVACLLDCHNRGKRQVLVTKNAAPEESLARLHIPRVFEAIHQTKEKVNEIVRIVETHRIPIADCVVVNDSFTELFELQRRLPGLRTVTPDALAALGREGIS
jgi:predicted HAD superfamily phosphohydrolase YqeG